MSVTIYVQDGVESLFRIEDLSIDQFNKYFVDSSKFVGDSVFCMEFNNYRHAINRMYEDIA